MRIGFIKTGSLQRNSNAETLREYLIISFTRTIENSVKDAFLKSDNDIKVLLSILESFRIQFDSLIPFKQAKNSILCIPTA